MINILIAEDSHEVRLSLVNILKTDPEIRIIGEANNGLQAVHMAKTLLSDLVLMDIQLPKLDGLEAAKQIKQFCAANDIDMKILILSTFYDDDYVLKSREYGVDGYLLKGLGFDKLASAIKNTCNNLVMLDRVIYEKQNRLAGGSSTRKYDTDLLTNSELEVLKLIVNGNNNVEIAAEMFLSEGTVRNYVSTLLSKLRCKNSRELAVYGLRAGL
jgi:DNA-binding NarL/FixJ family response regulator